MNAPRGKPRGIIPYQIPFGLSERLANPVASHGECARHVFSVKEKTFVVDQVSNMMLKATSGKRSVNITVTSEQGKPAVVAFYHESAE